MNVLIFTEYTDFLLSWNIAFTRTHCSKSTTYSFIASEVRYAHSTTVQPNLDACTTSPEAAPLAASVDVDVDVDVEDLRAQANASMPASYIAN